MLEDLNKGEWKGGSKYSTQSAGGGATGGHQGTSNQTEDSDAARRNAERNESRKRISMLLKQSESRHGLRRPRWRIEMDLQNGLVLPFQDAEALEAESMRPIEIFRAAACAVLMITSIRRQVFQKRQSEKAKKLQDLDAMLKVYFDTTRAWLGKLVKAPILSVLHEPSLVLNVHDGNSQLGSSLSISKKMGSLFNKHSSTVAAAPTAAQLAAEKEQKERRIKVKVRVKGILDLLIRAIERQEIPSGILEFLKRFSTDGVYFPASYPLFPQEVRHLDWDELGASHRMMEPFAPDSEISRAEMMLTNFVCVRLLIPHVVLAPWDVGIGTKTNNKQVLMNLRVLASVLFLACNHGGTLPDLLQQGERTSFSIPSSPDGAEEGRFGKSAHVTALLLPARSFPVEDGDTQFMIAEQRASSLLFHRTASV
ncbi:TPA: hypothetical protein N0F65_001172 [Lagenidium giganteum]|uniref:Uncharacterized protein n=1 Tax=Lagenidium giganteum TaxID=4803 RepID=A0AAV2Z075_9STRA|nr:TPA: hypothetical protein N0F65_001172 [Lagenidium giganteum]